MMMFKIGQTVWLRPLHCDIYSKKNAVPAEVTLVGRKYLHVRAHYFDYKFALDDFSHDIQETSSDYALHLTEQEVYDYLEMQMMIREISKKLPRVGYDCLHRKSSAFSDIVDSLRLIDNTLDEIESKGCAEK